MNKQTWCVASKNVNPLESSKFGNEYHLKELAPGHLLQHVAPGVLEVPQSVTTYGCFIKQFVNSCLLH